MEAILLIGIFAFLAAALLALGWALLQPTTNVRKRMDWLMGRGPVEPQPPRPRRRLTHVLEPLSKAIPSSLAGASEIQNLLIHAGYREERHVRIFSASRLLAVIVVALVMLVAGVVSWAPLLALALAGLAYFYPLWVLKRRVKRRQSKLQHALPDALDLCVICVEAGLGLDESLRRVGAEIAHAHPELASEFEQLDLELRAGKPRADALRNLAARTGLEDIRLFVGMLIQTDHYGTSIAGALRIYSESFRTSISQQVQERAARTTFKMVPVLVLCIFPAMFVPMLGPPIIAFLRLFTAAVGQ